MDNVVVYIEAWQMQCCGEPFAKGDIVSWEAFIATDSLEIDGKTVNIDFYEEHSQPKNKKNSSQKNCCKW